MNAKIIFTSEREPRVADWPDQTWYISHESPERALQLQKEYKEACQQAIANAVPFKLDEDKATIELAISSKVAKDEHEFCSWQPESNKPYDVPVSCEIEFGLWCVYHDKVISNYCTWCGFGNNKSKECGGNYAFIRQSKEQATLKTLGQPIFSIEPTDICEKCGQPLLDRLHYVPKKQAKVETQDELWDDVDRNFV